MGQIYHQAPKVIIWLGDEDQDVKRVFAFIRTIALLDEENITAAEVQNTLRNIWDAKYGDSASRSISPHPLLTSSQTIHGLQSAGFCNKPLWQGL
jgi:hypothetical protein